MFIAWIEKTSMRIFWVEIYKVKNLKQLKKLLIFGLFVTPKTSKNSQN